MRTSKAEVFLHFVWATKNRQPSISPALEPEMYRVIQSQVKKLGCDTVAIGGVSDHVHLLVKYGRSATLGQLMNLVKGVSSSFMNDRMRGEVSAFRWQPTYGVLSVSPNQVKRVQEYIACQKEHHAEDTTHPMWEETETEPDGNPTSPEV